MDGSLKYNMKKYILAILFILPIFCFSQGYLDTLSSKSIPHNRFSDSVFANYYSRRTKMDNACAYIKFYMNDSAKFERFLNTSDYIRVHYINGSDSIINWLKATYPNTNLYNPIWQRDLIMILK